MRLAAIAIGFLAAAMGCASAETPEQRQACTDSAFQFCQHAMPDRERVFGCLIQNKDAIAPLCREALAPYLKPERTKQASKTKIKPAAKSHAKANAKTAKAKTKPNAAAKNKKVGTKSKKVAAPLNLNPKAR